MLLTPLAAALPAAAAVVGVRCSTIVLPASAQHSSIKEGAGAWELRSRRSNDTVEEEVVGRKGQPLTGPPRHEVQPAAAALKYSQPFCTVKLRPLQNDVLEIRPFQPRPQLHIASCNEHLSTATVHSATAPRCLERQPQRSAMLSLSEVPYCESAVMKTRLNCHERARMSAAAATGSIGSIFDVSMARGGRQQRPTATELWRVMRGVYLSVLRGVGLGAAPQTTFVRGPRKVSLPVTHVHTSHLV